MRVVSLHASMNMLLIHDVQYSLTHRVQGLMTLFMYLGSLSFGKGLQQMMHCTRGSWTGALSFRETGPGGDVVVAGVSVSSSGISIDIRRCPARKKPKSAARSRTCSIASEAAALDEGWAGALLRLCRGVEVMVEDATVISS